MKTYAERECFRPSHVKLLRLVEILVGRVSDAWNYELRCHELARAVHLVVYPEAHVLEVVDGHCGIVEHSWLQLAAGPILDVYAPGRLPAVQIVDPLVGNYRPGPRRKDVRQPIIDRLVAEMRATAGETSSSSGAARRRSR